MSDDIRVLLVDDHALVRSALADRLQGEPDLSVIAVASTADEAIDRVVQHHPDIVVMDIDMPGLICFDAARRISDLEPNIKIIFLSAFLHDRYVEQALRVKASGYLTKREPIESVIAAIREVASGGAFFSDEVRSRIVVDSRGTSLAGRSTSRLGLLTPREREILEYIARGMAKKEIAATMDLSVKTVDHHATNLMGKLEIHDRVELARFAIREGLADA